VSGEVTIRRGWLWLAAQRRRQKVRPQVWLVPKRMAISKVRATCAAPPMSGVQAFPRSASGQPAYVPATWSAEFGDRGAQLIQGRAHQFAQFLLVARCDPCGVRLALYRGTGYRYGETFTLHSLAKALHAAGQPAAARTELTAALRLAAETGNTYQQASTHRDLAESHHRAGQDEQARHHWQQALTLYTQLGAPEADQMRGQLSAASPD